MQVNPGDIFIKNAMVLEGLMLKIFDPLLSVVLAMIVKQFGCRVSESWRPARHKNDLHSLGRAIDLSSWVYKDFDLIKIETWINDHWIYDPARPKMKVALYHKTKNGAWHFHIQVHPNTRAAN
ncbi:MAG: hypothetical protein HOE02_05700 [Candidatus Marinimicrobia bacterium]|jgi:hypothetical protein|nr:hypothetical protein [Candidatus Neomarinimicrobiota bacterium]